MTRFLVSTATAAILAASPALAELTVDEAWTVWKAQFTALGLRHEATETRDGDALQIGDLRLTLDFPMEVGNAYLTMPGPRFAPLQDGKVAITMAPSGMMSVGGEIAGEGSFAMAFQMESGAVSGVMSGIVVDAVTDWTSDAITATLVDVAVSGEQAVDVSGTLRFAPFTSRVATEMNKTHVTVTAQSEFDGYDLSYALSLPVDDTGGVQVTGTETAGKSTSETVLKLPSTGIDPLGLHLQLLDGMSLSNRMTTTENHSTDQTTFGDTVISKNKTFVRFSDGSVQLDRAGLKAVGTLQGVVADLLDEEIPFPISFESSAIDVKMLIPLLMGEGQDAALRMGLHEVTLNDGFWAMVDPGKQLPRDPMTMVLDAGSKVSILFDFLDVRALLDGAEPPTLPVMAKTATVNELRLSGAGVEVTGKGDFTFDYNDWTTFDGMPAPDGRASFTISGAFGLMDKLIAMGLMSEGDAMGMRMMMGMFTKPGEGEDIRTTEIEIRKTGEIMANGQRLQ